jgi:hypothetical protein
MRTSATGFIAALLCSILVFSCKARKEAMPTSSVSGLSAREVLERSARNSHFGEMKAKVSINYETDDQRQGFNANVRMMQDSIIWVSIAPLLGIEMVRAVITPDSLKLIDRFNKRYYLGRFDRLNQLLDVALDFAMLQSLITGNNVNLYAPESYTLGSTQQGYLLEAGGKGGRRRAKMPLRVEQQTQLDPQHFTVDRAMLYDTANGNRLEAVYEAPKALGAVFFPERMNVIISGKQKAKADIQWSKMSLGTGQDYPFSIPPSYEQIR